MAERQVFLDTGYLISLEDADDENHPAAREHREGLQNMPAFVTTTYVLDETVTFFSVRGQNRKAVELGQMLLTSPSVTLIHVSDELLRHGLDLLSRRPDKTYSLTDCISFVVMRERSLGVAFAFDRHFEQEGFVRKSHQSSKPGGKLPNIRIPLEFARKHTPRSPSPLHCAA